MTSWLPAQQSPPCTHDSMDDHDLAKAGPPRPHRARADVPGRPMTRRICALCIQADILGRTHRINRPAKDWRIDGKKEGAKRRIVEGCDTNRAARRLNDRGIKTTAKRRWGGTRLSRLIDSPVYICILKFGDERSGPLDNSHPLYVIFPWRLRWHRYLRDRRITI